MANAGTTATGAVDPLPELAEFARRHGLWLHVDAAYGGFAALAPSARPLFEGIAAADSVTLDPHKWLYLPMGCGCVLYRDPAAARAAFSHNAEYTRPIGLERDEAFAFWDYGPELSRPFRALDLWLLMKFVGATALGDAIDRNIACAKYLERLVRQSDDFEMLAPVELSVFCFRHLPRASGGRSQCMERASAARAATRRQQLSFECDGTGKFCAPRVRVELPHHGARYGNTARRRAARCRGPRLTRSLTVGALCTPQRRDR